MEYKNRTRKRSFTVNFVSALMLALILTVSVLPAADHAFGAPALQTSTLTFTAEADAHVQQSNPSNNYGNANYLLVDSGSNSDVESFIRFTVNGAAGTIQSALVRVYVARSGSSNGPAIYAAGNSWTESGITWNNRPARTSGMLDNIGSTGRNNWIEYNVAAVVNGNGTYTFVLAADSSDAIRFSAREGNRPPELVVTFNPSPGTATTTRTATAVNTTAATATATRTATAANTLAATATPTRTATRTNTPAATQIDPPPNQAVTFNPEADSYVNSSNPSTNYGTQTQLRGDGSPVVRSYLRFNVQGMNGAVTRATLRVYANSASSGGYEIRGVSDNTWGETAITYNNAPVVGGVLDSSGGFNAGVWTAVDVTAHITGNGTYSLALTVPGSTAISFASREAGSNAPQLVLEAGGGAAVTATSTRTATPINTTAPSATPTRTATAVNTAAPSATATRTATRTPTSAPTSSSSVVLVGAGDITSCSRSEDEQTAQLLDGIPGTVFTAGDNAYVDGTYTEYLNCYDPTWGRHKSRTKPSPGNHDYLTSGAAGYFQYFNNIPSYYAYDLGAWRIYSLNSEISVSSTSAQATWLQNDLAANPRQCVAAYWHKPRWSSGSNHGSNSGMQTIWQILYDAGAELVINGHEHQYERFAEMNASGAAVSQGLREIVAGTGGAGLYPFGTPLAASQVRNNTAYGVLKLTLRSTGYDWQFVPVAGSSFTDSGSSNCH